MLFNPERCTALGCFVVAHVAAGCWRSGLLQQPRVAGLANVGGVSLTAMDSQVWSFQGLSV